MAKRLLSSYVAYVVSSGQLETRLALRLPVKSSFSVLNFRKHGSLCKNPTCGRSRLYSTAQPPTMTSERRPRVLVVGSGCSGLTALKNVSIWHNMYTAMAGIYILGGWHVDGVRLLLHDGSFSKKVWTLLRLKELMSLEECGRSRKTRRGQP